jgi:hypothetical protein
MADIDQSRLAIIPDIQKGLDYCRQQIILPNGLNLEELWAAWAEREKQRLPSPGAHTDFDELCNSGCMPRVLASIIALIRYAPQINEWWDQTLGNVKANLKLVSLLEKTATALESFYVPGSTPGTQKLMDVAPPGELSPFGLVAAIRDQREMLLTLEGLAAKFDVNPFPEIARYLLVGYVWRATGTFHDRNVSGILGAVVGPVDYNEVAQRMWRYRNYERLEQHLSVLADMLHCLGLAVSNRT